MNSSGRHGLLCVCVEGGIQRGGKLGELKDNLRVWLLMLWACLGSRGEADLKQKIV